MTKMSRRRSESERERQEAYSEMNLHFLPRLICQHEQIIPLRTQECDTCMGRRIIFGELRKRDEMRVLRSRVRSRVAYRHSGKRQDPPACEKSLSSGGKSGEMTLIDDSSEEVGPQM